MFIPFEEGEIIVAKVHRHWWFIAVRVLGLILVAPSPLLLYWIVSWLGYVELVGQGTVALMTLLVIWIAVLWVLFWQFWTTYYMDVWVVTNRRIIDVDYQRLFDRNIGILHLDRVQDVSTHIQGLIPTLLKYGQVIVQSAGSERQFIIDQISDPEHLRNIISDVAGKVPPRRMV